MTKTLVTNDFDGCVSPIDHDRDFTLEKGWIQFRSGLPIDVHESVVEFLRELSQLPEDSGIVPIWASTWEEMIDHLEEDSAGLIPTFPWIPVSGRKAEAIIEKVENEGFDRLVAIEDGKTVIAKLRAWAEANPQVEVLLINPKLEVGLTPKHIEKIREFLKL